MTVETSRKILKIFGIISIIIGALGAIIGIVGVVGGGALASAGDDMSLGVGAAAIIVSVVLLLSGIVSLIEGIFSVRAANDVSKIMPAWVFAIISLVFSVVGIFTNIKSGTSSIVGAIIGLGISVLIFVAANTIKKSL
ncbi:MAG: hypothetical protein K6G67_08610 [Lachnospiraceae bacterium]|nr:hypothetical protein [Lachnospiraceae bacterium]